MKKFFTYIVIFHFLFINLSIFTFQTVQADAPIYASENKFVVTAYYSPLPNQQHYFKWSYEADIKLNGRWVTWASGKDVFVWMIAAPKSYAFGTKIYLDGIWVGEVADRWWAIVSTDPNESRWYDYDRLDIWMGYGDEWLARALAFGKQTVHGYVLADSSSQTTIHLESFSAPLSVLTKYKVENNVSSLPKISYSSTPTSVNSDWWNISIDPKNPNSQNVKNLQKVLHDMWIYKGEINGKYETIKNIIIEYQILNSLVTAKESKEAWYVWPKTLTQLKKDYPEYKKQQDEIQNKHKAISEYIDDIGSISYGQTNEKVRTLQQTLKILGYFDKQDTANFGDITKDALIQYQLEKNIISSKDSVEAGYFGPKTKQQLKQDLSLFVTQLEKPQVLVSYK